MTSTLPSGPSNPPIDAMPSPNRLMTPDERSGSTEPLTVLEDPITGVWHFKLRGKAIEIEPSHGYLKIDGVLHRSREIAGLQQVEDLAGAPLRFVERLILAECGFRKVAESQAQLPAPTIKLQQGPTESRAPAVNRSAPETHSEPVPPRVAEKASAVPHESEARQREESPMPDSEPEPSTDQRASYPQEAFSTEEAAEYLGLSPKTLETKRTRGGGPIFVKLGRRVVYRRKDLDQWLDERVRRSTSDTGQS